MELQGHKQVKVPFSKILLFYYSTYHSTSSLPFHYTSLSSRYNTSPTSTMSNKVIIQLPNLVVSFLAEKFDVNENYAVVSEISREWLGDKCGLGERDKRILQKVTLPTSVH